MSKPPSARPALNRNVPKCADGIPAERISAVIHLQTWEPAMPQPLHSELLC